MRVEQSRRLPHHKPVKLRPAGRHDGNRTMWWENLSLAETLSEEEWQGRRVSRSGVVQSCNGGLSGVGAEQVLASRREAAAVFTAGRAARLDAPGRRIVTSGRQAFVAVMKSGYLGKCNDLSLLRSLQQSGFRSREHTLRAVPQSAGASYPTSRDRGSYCRGTAVPADGRSRRCSTRASQTR